MTAASSWSSVFSLSGLSLSGLRSSGLRSSGPSALSAATLVGLASLACSPPTPTPAPSVEAPKAAPPTTEQQFAAAAKPSSVADPPWFSPAIFAGATVTKKGRSPADDQGRFTAQILFSLPDGATLADCTDPIAKATPSVVPQLEREELGGRVTLKGTAKEYDVLAICGEAKGKMTAFVSYRWTAATASVAQ